MTGSPPKSRACAFILPLCPRNQLICNQHPGLLPSRVHNSAVITRHVRIANYLSRLERDTGVKILAYSSKSRSFLATITMSNCKIRLLIILFYILRFRLTLVLFFSLFFTHSGFLLVESACTASFFPAFSGIFFSRRRF